eukprot:TRINITY_DN5940_c0_g1_i1.p1 TRINITY_DN5940_c0_g1~~TRINITY_DN5940_c0_g1_i1.p1  ORF type:complete len:232 (-),score=-17.28 TRINITY_DN5940_c0_g1_i1:26-721(-)
MISLCMTLSLSISAHRAVCEVSGWLAISISRASSFKVYVAFVVNSCKGGVAMASTWPNMPIRCSWMFTCSSSTPCTNFRVIPDVLHRRLCVSPVSSCAHERGVTGYVPHGSSGCSVFLQLSFLYKSRWVSGIRRSIAFRGFSSCWKCVVFRVSERQALLQVFLRSSRQKAKNSDIFGLTSESYLLRTYVNKAALQKKKKKKKQKQKQSEQKKKQLKRTRRKKNKKYNYRRT